MRRVKKESLGKHYSLAWNYIKESKNYILLIIVLFLWSCLIAFYFQPTVIVDLIQKFIEQLMEKTQGLGFKELLFFILDNNFKSSFFGLFFGIFLGIFSIITTILNGYLIGFVLQRAIDIEGPLIILRLLPHGVFELPAVILSLGLGVKLGFSIFSKEPWDKFVHNLKNSIAIFLLIVLPLLIIAAIIESALIFLWA